MAVAQLLCSVVRQELQRFLDRAREDSLLPSFTTGLIAGGVTNSAWLDICYSAVG